MHSTRRMIGKRCRAKAILVAAVGALFPLRSAIAQSQWIGGTSNWNTAANWSPAGVPGAADNVSITSTLGLAETITYNYPGPNVTLGELDIDLTGGGAAAASTFSIPSGKLFTGEQIIGDSGNGAIAESGGNNTLITGWLVVGNSSGATGSYSLSGAGALSVNNQDANGVAEYIGSSGVGNFNQSGGSNSANAGIIILGFNAGSIGGYTLNGGLLESNGADANGVSEYVGYSGTGSVNHSSGTNSVGSDLEVAFNAGSTGSYVLSGIGVLMAGGNEWIGQGNSGPSSGVFNQSGDSSNTANSNLNVGVNAGAIGTYNLGGGTNNVGGDLNVALNAGSTGSFVFSGGTNNVGGNFNVGLRAGSTGSYVQSGGHNFIGADLNVASGSGSTGNFNLSAGFAGVSGSVYVGGSASGAGGMGSLSVSGTGTLGITSVLTVYNTPGSGVTLNGGTLIASSLNINGVPSLFNWSSGSLGLSSGITLDSSSGPTTSGAVFGASLVLAGSQVLGIGGNENVGGTGSFNLTVNSGGTNSVGGTLTVYNTPGTGITLNGGTINAASINLNGVPSLFNWVSGTLGLTGGVTLDPQAAVNTSGGIFGSSLVLGPSRSLNVTNSEIVGITNAFSLALGGGKNTAGSAYLGYNGGATGTFTVDSGTLSAGSLYVGYSGTGVVNQSGGTSTVNAGNLLYLGFNSGSTGTYILGNNGVNTLTTTFEEFVGYSGTGTFNQNGGTNRGAAFIILGNNGGSTGTYILSGSGSISAAGTEIIGPLGTGIFNQTGGTNTAGSLSLRPFGTYAISGGGSLGVSGNEFVTGMFNQGGGTNSAVSLSLGAAGATGTYSLSGTGSLSVSGVEKIGNGGAANFLQSGGVNSAGTITLSSVSTYSMTGGTIATQGFDQIGGSASFVSLNLDFNDIRSLTLSGGALSAGTVNLAGGGLNLSGGTLSAGTFNINAGQLILPTSTLRFAVLNQTAGSVDLNPLNIDTGFIGAYNLSGTGTLTGQTINVGLTAVGTFNQTGGTVNSGTFGTNTGLYIGVGNTATGTYTLSGTGTVSVKTAEFVGYSGVGTFNQSGGNNSESAANTGIFVGYNSGSTGSYLLSGAGTLSTNWLYVAYNGLGSFNQSGGIVYQVSNIYVGYGNTGAYSLSGTGSIQGFNEFIGYSSTGSFNQSGGTNTIPSAKTASLIIGNNNGSTGTYAQSGGVNSAGNGVTLGFNAGSNGNYILSGTGVLNSTGTEVVGFSGTGNFNQSGSTNTANSGGTGTNSVVLGYNAGSTGTYTLSGTGTLAASAIEVVGYGGTGIFNQSGGENLIPEGLSLGEMAGSTGTYILSGTSSLSSGGVNDGFQGAASFVQSGGTVSLNLDAYNQFGVGPAGVYSLSGTGSLSVVGNEYVEGIFNQSGGSNTVNAGVVYIISVAGSSSAYNLSGGAASVLTGGTSSYSGSIFVGGYEYGPQGTGFLTVNNSGQLSVAGTLKVWNSGRANLDVPNTSVGNLAIVGNGIVNLNGGLTINYGSPATDPISSVVSYLQSGYNGGAWTGTSGIISTSVQNQSGPAVSVGYADGNFDSGTAAGPNQIVVKYTLTADANLDGLVNFSDLVAVIQNFNKSGTDWAGGNFFYGTSTNFADLVAVVQNFNKTLLPPGGSGAALGGTTLPVVSSTDVSLPEPGAIAMIFIAATGLVRRRRRKYIPRRSLLKC